MKNVTNMTTSIISAVITAIFIPILIVRYVCISKLGVIFLSIGYPILLIYFILKSIYFGLSNLKAKDVLYRIINVLIEIFILLIISYFCLSLNSYIKWDRNFYFINN